MADLDRVKKHGPIFSSGFGPDPLLLAVVFLILAMGITMVTSAGYIIAAAKTGDGFYYTKKQGLAMLIGLALMYLFSVVNPAFWKRMSPIGLFIGMALLLMVFVPGVGVELGGSKRWLRLPFGFFFQPSEIAKYTLIIYLASLLSDKGDGIRDFAVGFLPNLIVIGAMVLLLLMQPDFGAAVIVTFVGFLMLFVAGVRFRHLLGSLVLCVPFLFHFAISAQYRLSRLKSFFDPWSDPLDSGFQIIQSLIAFGCGGLWGVGVGKGLQKLYYLPQPHTDFIFAVIGEELGLAGVALIIALFYIIICRGLSVAIRSRDRFNKLLAFGITSLIGLQAIVNMAVAMGALPTKGLPLPFLSLGGTSMIVNLAALGILMAITGQSNNGAGGPVK
jgi:cell division protein FtsW